MRMNRLFEIVYILLDKKKTTANELAVRFEVSKRTILRDIETLAMAGIPIYTTQGKGGGISILENFVLNKAVITDEEQEQILFALKSLTATQNINVKDIISKLGAFFEKTDTDWIEVDFSRWGNATDDRETFEKLKSAVIKRHAISFSYLSSYGEMTSRVVYPLKLVFKSKAWYVQAYCLLKKDYRTFKVSRMLHMEVLEEGFAEKVFSSPPIDWGEVSSGLIHLTLAFSAEVAYRVYDEFDAKDICKNEDGSYIVAIDLPNDFWLYGFLLSFGAAVRVVEPQSVRDNLLVQIEAIKKSYSGIR